MILKYIFEKSVIDQSKHLTSKKNQTSTHEAFSNLKFKSNVKTGVKIFDSDDLQ